PQVRILSGSPFQNPWNPDVPGVLLSVVISAFKNLFRPVSGRAMGTVFRVMQCGHARKKRIFSQLRLHRNVISCK
ncbi:hypothetical protein, partial [Thalassospira xiamenensis]|uniref:hypothetical protein n=1 Tax=Thalassospira xiamenensis TaxID=220697 RepID=UPI001C693EC5